MFRSKTIAALTLISLAGLFQAHAATNLVGPDDASTIDGKEIGVHFSGEISLHKIEELKAVIDSININNPKASKINLFINSWGGDVSAAHAAYWAIKSSAIPVQTVNIGVAGSAAVEIYCAGHERAMVDGAYFFVHPAGLDIASHIKPDNAQQLSDHFKLIHASMRKTYQSCTKLTVEEIDTLFLSEFYSRYIGDTEALRIGLTTHVLEKLPTSAASAYVYDDPKDRE